MFGEHRVLPTDSPIRATDQTQNSPDRFIRHSQQQRFAATISPRFSQIEVPSHTSTSPASSPASALSSSLYDFTGSTFDFEINTEDVDLSMLPGNNFMMHQPDQWSSQSSNLNLARPIGHSATFAHNRDSSISSLGSVGPASPFSHTTTNPHIVLNEPLGNNTLNAMSSYYEDQPYPMAKQASSSTNDSFYSQTVPFHTSSDGLPIPTNTNAYGSLMVMSQNGSSRSQPVSTTSSIASNSPATPLLDSAEDDSRRRNGMTQPDPPLFDNFDEVFESLFMQDLEGAGSLEANDDSLQISNTVFPGAPNKAAERPVPDFFGDEMYKSAGFTLPTSAPMSQHMSQPTSQQFGGSVHNSPAHPGPSQDYTSSPRNNNLRFGSAPLHHERGARQQGSSTPQTISPKDAVLEYREQDGEANGTNYSLFAQRTQQAQFAAANQMNQPFSAMSGAVVTSSPVVYNNYLGPQMAPNMQQQLQNYPFVAQQQALPQPAPAQAASMNTTRPVVPIPRTVASLDMLSQPVPGSQRPGIVTTDGGTYTCTYHGCTQRFETPSALQKHKREGHRQMHALTTARRPDASTIGPMNTQAGPHKCERINPSTGKPCNTIFSRPYDLTRHEDTIHNARKQKVRCKLCVEEKTFSRADALTRHFRVCHPEVDFQGKHRKRGGGSRVN